MTKQANQIINSRRIAIALPAGRAPSDVRKGICSIEFKQRTAGGTDHGGRLLANMLVALAERVMAQQWSMVIAEDLRAKVPVMGEPASPQTAAKPRRCLIRSNVFSIRQRHEIVRVTTAASRSAQPRVCRSLRLELKGLYWK
jgi:hypothetical protein